MKIARYELKVVYKKELILTMEDDVDSEELLKIFLETQLKEEKEQNELLGIIAEKVSEEGCTEQCESCQKYCPVSEECMATDENVRCTECEYLCETCGNVGITARKAFVFRKVNSLVPGATRRVQKNTQYQQATPLDCHTGFLSGSLRQLVRENP